MVVGEVEPIRPQPVLPTPETERARVTQAARLAILTALERYGQAFLEVLGGAAEAPAPVADLRHELVSLARAGMTPAQIAGQLNCGEKSVYNLLAEAIASQQLSLEQALDLPEELLGEIQDAFLDGDGDLPPAAAIAPMFQGRVEEGVLYCVRAALQSEFEL